MEIGIPVIGNWNNLFELNEMTPQLVGVHVFTVFSNLVIVLKNVVHDLAKGASIYLQDAVY